MRRRRFALSLLFNSLKSTWLYVQSPLRSLSIQAGDAQLAPRAVSSPRPPTPSSSVERFRPPAEARSPAQSDSRGSHRLYVPVPHPEKRQEWAYTRLFAVKPIGDNFNWLFKVRCSGCREEHPNWMGIDATVRARLPPGDA